MMHVVKTNMWVARQCYTFVLWWNKYWGIASPANEVAVLLYFGIIAPNTYAPKKCMQCGNHTYKEKIIDTLDGHTVLEMEAICSECDSYMGYWQTGNWKPV